MTNNMKKTGIVSAFVTACAMVLAVGCSTAPSTPEDMSRLDSQSRTALSTVESRISPGVNDAVGYAVFPDVSEGAAGIGGAYGKGVVYERGTIVGYADMTYGSLGWQLGGKTFKEIIVFHDPNAFRQFKEGKFEFDAEASAMASDASAEVKARTLKGVRVYTIDKDGLMFAAAVGGQKFTFVPKF